MRRAIAFLALMALLASGCAYRPAPTLYVALGEMPGIRRLVEALTEEYRADTRINGLFQQTDFAYFKQRLAEDICVKAGGPCVYQGLSAAEAHSGMNISEAEFNWFVEDSRLAMEQIGLPVTTQNRLLALLARDHEEVVGQ